jgi:hypothetical protein
MAVVSASRDAARTICGIGVPLSFRPVRHIAGHFLLALPGSVGLLVR